MWQHTAAIVNKMRVSSLWFMLAVLNSCLYFVLLSVLDSLKPA